MFTYYQEHKVKFFKLKNLLLLELAPFLHSAILQYSSYFHAFDTLLYNINYVTAKRLNISLESLQHASMLIYLL